MNSETNENFNAKVCIEIINELVDNVVILSDENEYINNAASLGDRNKYYLSGDFDIEVPDEVNSIRLYPTTNVTSSADAVKLVDVEPIRNAIAEDSNNVKLLRIPSDQNKFSEVVEDDNTPTDTTTITANDSKLENKLIRKQSSVYADIKCKRFISTEAIIRTKKKNKNKELGYEIIKLEVYKYKCGFTTNRPLA